MDNAVKLRFCFCHPFQMFMVSPQLSREPESENDSVETSCHPELLSKGAAIARHSVAFRAGVRWTGEVLEACLHIMRRQTLAFPQFLNSVLGSGVEPSIT